MIISQTNSAPWLRKKTNSKFILLVVLGEYISERGGEIWLSDLLYLLDLLGVGEHTGRSTINRMAREGWFLVDRDGRNSRIKLTQKGYNVFEGGTLRVNETTTADWDGRWHMVTYSLPEEKRKIRNDLRKQLTWLGYGSLHPGFWFSPNDRHQELAASLADLGVADAVHLFSGTYDGALGTAELVQLCWDLEGLSAEYDQFNGYYQKVLEAFAGIADPDPEACFVRRAWLTIHLFPILQKDPNLPLTLLPNNWSGRIGRTLFTEYRKVLTPFSDQFMATILNRTA